MERCSGRKHYRHIKGKKDKIMQRLRKKENGRRKRRKSSG